MNFEHAAYDLSLTVLIDWAAKALKESDLKAAVVAQTKWSTILKLSTSQGSVHIK